VRNRNGIQRFALIANPCFGAIAPDLARLMQ
jgi:hypothetical protein